MALTRIGGGMWVPSTYFSLQGNAVASASVPMFGPSDACLVDADQEEAQFIGRVVLPAGTGSKTFGTSGSGISWLPGASITFQATATLRVGIKKSSVVDAANGPPARATIGSAAFNVWKDLTGGTDTITSTTWRTDSMANTDGANVTVSHGDLIAVCFLMSITSSAQSVKVRGAQLTSLNNFPATTLVTSGPTYAAQLENPNVVLTFDDGTIGWLDGTFLFSTAGGSEAPGNGNIYANILQLPFDCAVDAIALPITEAGTTNFDVGLWSTPAGTPTAMTNGTLNVDPQILGSSAVRVGYFTLPAEVSLSKNTAYAAGLKQNSATGITIYWNDVAAAAQHQANGLDSNTYAAKSSAGASFSAQNSSLRRMVCFVRISSIDVTAAGGAHASTFVG